MVNDLGKRTERDDAAAAPSDRTDEGGDGAEVTSMDPRIDRLIGRSLQAHYADIVSTPLPDTILVLLAQLEAKERNA